MISEYHHKLGEGMIAFSHVNKSLLKDFITQRASRG